MGDENVVYRIVVGLFMVITGLLVFSSCATMKKEECLTANWYDIGFEDGAKGYKASYIARHRKACSKYEVAPDLDMYLQGRDAGLIEYCTPYNGFHLGHKGLKLNDVCKGDLKERFLEAYNNGLDIYLFKRDIRKEEDQLAYLKNQKEDIETQIEAKEKELTKGCSDSKVCRKILDEIRELDREKADLEMEIFAAQGRVYDMQDTLAEMVERHRF